MLYFFSFMIDASGNHVDFLTKICIYSFFFFCFARNN